VGGGVGNQVRLDKATRAVRGNERAGHLAARGGGGLVGG
jgi:hypothetical protein